MERKSLQIKILNANLPYNKELCALVSIQGDNNSFERKTTITKEGGPVPDFPMTFTINISTALTQTLVIKLRAHRMFMFRKKVIGEVPVSIQELLEIYGDAKDEKNISCSVETPAGAGLLDFSFKFIEVMTFPSGHVTAAAVPPPTGGGGVLGAYQHPPDALGEGPYHAPGGGNPQAGYGYGAPPPQQNHGTVAAVAEGAVMGLVKSVAYALFDAIGNCFT